MRYLLSEIAAICGGRLVLGGTFSGSGGSAGSGGASSGGASSGIDREVTRVVTDSRSFAGSGGGLGGAPEHPKEGAKGGDLGGAAEHPKGGGAAFADTALFAAIRTANRDGAAFVGEMYARGVRAFLVERRSETNDPNSSNTSNDPNASNDPNDPNSSNTSNDPKASNTSNASNNQNASNGSNGSNDPNDPKVSNAAAGFDVAPFPEAGFVVVGDTLKALQALAAHHRAGFTGRVVGITGSGGKTIVKEWIAQLTPPGVRVFRSPKSWNSQLGVPLSVLAARGDEDYIIIEAGISEPGEMAPLERIIRPDVGILTSVGGAHAENFASLDQLREEKMKLFSRCPEVLFGEGEGGTERKAGGGTEGGTEGETERGTEGGTKGKAEGETERKTEGGTERGMKGETEHETECKAEGGTDSRTATGFGNHTTGFDNRNAALAAEFWRHEGYPPEAAAMENLEPVATRLEVKEGLHGSIVINDTYNSDGASTAIALDFLARVAGSRPRIAIMPKNPQNAALAQASGVERVVEIGAEVTVDHFLRSITSAELQGRAILIKGGARMGFDRIGHALELRSHTTVLEVDLDAVIHNLSLYRQRLAPGGGVMAMIKANAYGHGSFEVARTLQAQGVDYLAVAFADEGVELRRGGITMPVVVLNADAGSFEPMIGARLEPEIYNFESLRRFVALLTRHGEIDYPIHIKLDTGMHRLGFSEQELPELAEALRRAGRCLRVATLFSHLAAADDPLQDDFTRRQIADFDRMSRGLAGALDYEVRRHLAGTGGIERFGEAHFDMVRPGLGLYGVGLAGGRRAATLKTRVVNVRRLAAGETVGYGRCGVLARDSVVATIPIGYADGLSRRLSGGAWAVLVNDKPAPTVGNVCMDSCMIDVTGVAAG
ncbi:MAG: alanine racemase, partial [Alistipes sp.]|nr:alanine racemase [Alistipes sp.]